MELKTLGEEAVTRFRGAVTVIRDGVAVSDEDHEGDIAVAGLARQNVASVSPKTSLADVVRALVDRDVGIVPVVDSGKTLGIISERDVIDALYEGADLDVVWAADVMRADPVSVPGGTSAISAGRRMVDEGVRHLLIDEPPGGVVSMRDIVGTIVR